MKIKSKAVLYSLLNYCNNTTEAVMTVNFSMTAGNMAEEQCTRMLITTANMLLARKKQPSWLIKSDFNTGTDTSHNVKGVWQVIVKARLAEGDEPDMCYLNNVVLPAKANSELSRVLSDAMAEYRSSALAMSDAETELEDGVYDFQCKAQDRICQITYNTIKH